MKVPVTESSEPTVTGHTPPPESSPPPRRRSHPLLVAALVLTLVVFAGAAAILGYAYYFQKPPTPTSQTPTANATTDLTARQTLDMVKQVFQSSPAESPNLAVPIRIAGYNYYTEIDPARSSGLVASVPYTDSAIATAKIAKALKEQHFNESVIQAGSGDSEYIARYTHPDVVCSVTATKTANNPTGSHEVMASCANMSDYVTTAATQKPFYEAYPSKPSASNLLFSGAPQISPSKTAGYQIASVSMGGVMNDGTQDAGGFAGLFYQTPDKIWHFFKGAQNTLPCSDYVTDDVKKAYAGMECTDTSGNLSKV